MKKSRSITTSSISGKVRADEKRSPCNDCPWRKDAPLGYWHPKHFRDVWFNCQDDGLHLMLCHKSKVAKRPIICAGYALIIKFNSIGLRFSAISGEFVPENYSAKGIPLHRSFKAMMVAQGLKLPARNIIQPRLKGETIKQTAARIKRQLNKRYEDYEHRRSK